MIYTNQSAVKIRLTGLGSLSDIVAQKIKYIEPDGVEGEWDATVEDASSGIIYYNLLPSQFLKEGTYRFWAKLTDTDGRTSIGDVATTRVYKEGEAVS